jgi:RND family efflux transporter MFP subunit
MMVQIGNKKLFYSVLLIVIVLALVSAGVLLRDHFRPKAVAAVEIPLVQTQVIQMTGDSQEDNYSGDVVGRYEIPVAFQVSGKLAVSNVDEGSVVQPGDLLMQVDPEDIQLSVDSSQSQLTSAEAESSLAKNNFDRSSSLYESGALSKADYESAQTAFNAAQATLNQATAQYQEASNQLQYCSLYAEDAGAITDVTAEVGQYVEAGTPVLTLVKNGDLEVEINVPENRIDDLYKASQIKVTFWALPDLSLDGQVREVAAMADPVANTFMVRISLSNPPPELKLGMTATVTVNGPGAQQQVAEIPLTAVYQTGDTPSVWVVQSDRAHLRAIKIAGFDGNQVQVGAGLNNGDIIVTAGVHELLEGQQVRLDGTAS